tara:strand:- start:1469 stop:2134 length:666 start_codon:yes stop_codon:yes gene_type:complete
LLVFDCFPERLFFYLEYKMELSGQHSNEDAFRILVLNRVWQPVNIVGIRRAVALLFQDNAQVIHPSQGNYEMFSAEEWMDRSITNPPRVGEASIRSVRLNLRVPQILLLRDFDRVPIQDTKLNRKNIFERDDYRCQYCGDIFSEAKLNLDHVIPRDRGGRTSWENLVTSCIECNSRKANRLPHQAGLALRRQPVRPKHRPFLSVLHRSGSKEVWKPFIGKI